MNSSNGRYLYKVYSYPKFEILTLHIAIYNIIVYVIHLIDVLNQAYTNISYTFL